MHGKYFTKSELACPCCGVSALMRLETVDRLDRLRELFGKPLQLSSAYRCPAHNAAVSSTGADGPHTTGQAVDVVCRGTDAFVLAGQAMRLGFTGIGVQQRGGSRFLHLDDLPNSSRFPRPWLWSYP
jgi:zinc D-Ala-D-Ala carboxypeptidase